MIGALHALAEHSGTVQRVAIVDLDVHHGNGTEDILRRYQRPDKLFFASIHLFDKEAGSEYEFYPGSGEHDSLQDNTVNVALQPLWRSTSSSSGRSPSRRPAAGHTSYRKQFAERVLPALRAFNADVIYLSSGFDGAKDDVGNVKLDSTRRVYGLDLLPTDFEWIAGQVQDVAELCCNGRVISVLEGGYGKVGPPVPLASASAQSPLVLDDLADNCAGHLSALLGQRARTDRGVGRGMFSTPVAGRGTRSTSRPAPASATSGASAPLSSVPPRLSVPARGGSGFRARRSPTAQDQECLPREGNSSAPFEPSPLAAPPLLPVMVGGAARAGSEDAVFWEIDTILKKRSRKKSSGAEYLVSWQGFPSAADNTWEPHANLLQDCPLLLQQFLASPLGSTATE